MKRLLCALLFLFGLSESSPAQSAIYLVRHAEKAPATEANAKDPDLSAAGQKRAAALAATLKDAGITAIYATEFKRTQQTARAIAAASGITLTIVPAKEIDALVARLKATRGNALVVGHSNTLPEIVRALGVSTPLTIEESEYDNLFILIPGAPAQLLRLRCP